MKKQKKQKHIYSFKKNLEKQTNLYLILVQKIHMYKEKKQKSKEFQIKK